MQPNIDEPLLGFDIKKAIGDKMLSSDDQSALRTTKIVLFVLTLLSGIAAIVVNLVLPDTFSLPLVTTTDYRNQPGTMTDGYPNVVLQIGYLADVGLLAGFVSILAAIGYFINAIGVHRSEMTQLARGANPWFWVFSALWTPLAFLTIAYLSGVHNIYVLVGVWFLVWGWIFLFWADDLLHSNTFVAVSNVLGANNMGYASMWSWIPTFLGVIYALAAYVIIFVYLGFTASAVNPPPSALLLATPITFAVLYLLLIPLVLILYRNDVLFTKIYYREMTFYIGSGVLVLIATWLTLAMIAISKPLPIVP